MRALPRCTALDKWNPPKSEDKRLNCYCWEISDTFHSSGKVGFYCTQVNVLEDVIWNCLSHLVFDGVFQPTRAICASKLNGCQCLEEAE